MVAHLQPSLMFLVDWASAAYTVVPMTLCTYWPYLCKETYKVNAGIVL